MAAANRAYPTRTALRFRRPLAALMCATPKMMTGVTMSVPSTRCRRNM